MRYGKLNCPEKNIWCGWINLNTGECNKGEECDVGTDAWAARKREQERTIEENRNKAAEETKEETRTTERKIIKIPDKHKAADPVSELIWKLQRTEEQMARAYRTGKDGFGDRLYREALELKQRIKERESKK